jgi:hypothetical protein
MAEIRARVARRYDMPILKSPNNLVHPARTQPRELRASNKTCLKATLIRCPRSVRLEIVVLILPDVALAEIAQEHDIAGDLATG